jgi:hypothetical protein
MKICSVGAELFHVYGRMYGRTDGQARRSSNANAPSNKHQYVTLQNVHSHSSVFRPSPHTKCLIFDALFNPIHVKVYFLVIK